MEKQTIQELIQEAKKIKFADPIKRKSWIVRTEKFIVDDKYNVNWYVGITTWSNLNKSLKNPHLINMYVISCWTSTDDDTFRKRYLR